MNDTVTDHVEDVDEEINDTVTDDVEEDGTEIIVDEQEDEVTVSE